MIPALIVLAGGAIAFSIWRNKEEAKTLADQAIRGAFRGKREIEVAAGRLLDQAWPQEDGGSTIWVNVDKPAAKATLHADRCRYVQSKHETATKGVGELKRDGGWLSFGSIEEALDSYPNAQRAADGCWSEA